MWSEEDSREFIDYGKYFVPGREVQLDTICRLIPADPEPFHVLELCCGEGLLAEAILERFPRCTVHGYDGSPEMLRQASSRLARFGRRFDPQPFDLADGSWRRPPWPLKAVVSTLCIHHLDGRQKEALFRDIAQMLRPSGALVIADLIEPASSLGLELAAEKWDSVVRQRSLDRAGDESAFDRFVSSQWNTYRFPDPIDKPSPLFEQLKRLEAAGFQAVDVYWMAAGHAVYGGQMPAD
ncbi:MAG: class I SAM-dependent methyltransferase [Chloroflexota bacterium]|nr:MAG: class I SAM-dependent methyltransferase [Chloroflexota bacterium]